MSASAILHIENGTCFGYRSGPPWKRQDRRLVEVEAPVRLGPGLHLLVAPNGTGKTTLLKTLAGLNAPLEGKLVLPAAVHYFADELKADPELTAGSFFRAFFKKESLVRAEKLAADLRLDLRKQIGKLSRGNRQKVLLILAEIGAGAGEGSFLLMDEPLTGLDAETRAQVTALWAGAGAGITRLVVMHELESVAQASSLLTIARGQLKHAAEKTGATWMDTYQALQA